ncbi:hypothetical protein NHQ30_004701 [Ciborinia camelliae]|nr:hypothetical protein NHQ30_004701 [Ciborinia camelliae]
MIVDSGAVRPEAVDFNVHIIDLRLEVEEARSVFSLLWVTIYKTEEEGFVFTDHAYPQSARLIAMAASEKTEHREHATISTYEYVPT